MTLADTPACVSVFEIMAHAEAGIGGGGGVGGVGSAFAGILDRPMIVIRLAIASVANSFEFMIATSIFSV